MKLHGNSLICGTVVAILAIQPVWAQTTQVTGVKINKVGDGINLVLDAEAGDRAQVFTTKRGNALIADLINTKLRLPQGNNFSQDNPAPGIASVTINQLDANSVRVVVTGSNGTPGAQPVTRGSNGLTLSFIPGNGTTAASPPVASPSAPAVPTVPTAPPTDISQQPAPAEGPREPSSDAPPFLPRAVAPPVGDIAISATDASPSAIDLGTQERIPRLVLRDAPAREVLSLLARAAGLNLAYAGGEEQKDGTPEKVYQLNTQSNTGSTEKIVYQKISIDIQNEPVQDVFNYVLRLSGLEASRSGHTIFVGAKLPNSTRDVVVRNLRLNQANVSDILRILVNLGAESAVNAEQKTTRVTTEVVGKANEDKKSLSEDSGLTAQRINFTDSVPVLRGLQVSGDKRTNTMTLIGPPKLVEMAIAQIVPLDVRRRQVAVNVKIVDVNLTGIKDFGTSFSFGIGNNYFSNDGGSLTSNFGGSRPATSAEVSSSVTSTPTTANPLSSANIFLNPQNPTTGVATAGISSNPTQTGLISYTPGTPGVITSVPSQFNPVTGVATQYTTQVTGQTPSTSTYGLPSLYQFPKNFLASLQAQVQEQNAKILTDPTLIVQEGETADVKLTQEVVGNIERQITRGDGTSAETVTAKKETVGLTLAIKVERIDDNGFISVSVAPTIASPQAPATINTGTGSQQIFLVSTRSLTSGLIRLRDGQTLILSGIIQDQDRTSVSKIPILGDIPLLGSLFRQTSRANQRNEVIVLLTPQLLDDSERSSYGYNYKPSPEVRGILERSGLQIPKK